MRWKQLMVVVGLMFIGIVGLAASCADQQARDAAARAQTDAAAAQAQIAIIEGYLRTNLPEYLNVLAMAICQLEVKNPGGLVAANRICPGGPGDVKPPPTYPPQ